MPHSLPKNVTPSATGDALPSAPRLEIRYRPISDITPDPRNPRVHTPRHVRQVAASIRAFGFTVPILIDGAAKVVAGHARLAAARQLGWTEVPTINVGHLSEPQLRAYMLADNRLNEISSWDDRLVGEILRDLSDLELDFSLDVTGFDTADIDMRIEGLALMPADGADPADQMPPPTGGVAVTRAGGHLAARPPSGDLCECPGTRLLHESDGRRVSQHGLHGPRRTTSPLPDTSPGWGAVQHREFAMGVGEMTTTEFTQFLTQALGHAARHSTDGSLHYVCMDWRHLRELLEAGGKVYGELKNICVWAKDNAGMGSLYRSQHELVMVYKHGTAAHRNNIELGRHGRNRTNVWHYAGVNSFNQATDEGNLLALHPTVKPVAMVADAILDCTARKAIVLDTFLGSGTTLMAAERVGRRCYGMELDALYVDTIIRRWQTMTGECARHADTNETFDELSQRRAEVSAAAGSGGDVAADAGGRRGG